MKLLKALVIGGALALSAAPALAQQKGGIVNVATVGEPPTLDPMVSTADLVGIITQHIFETLFTFDKDWKVTPLLAESLPELSPDGKIYTIKLRQGVNFHDGSAMTSEDVVASLEALDELASARQADRRHDRQGRGPRSGDRAHHPEGALRASARPARPSTTPPRSSCPRRSRRIR